MSQQLHVLHFNDVYRVGPQKIDNNGKTIDCTQFAQRLASLRGQDADRTLVLFSGDVFSPSVESSVTRGSHMVPVMNALAPDVTVTGNHDCDFGFPHLRKLIQDCNFPWLLSNVVDTDTGRVPEGFQEFTILDRGGIRVGVIGLIEEDWIATLNAWPSNFQWRRMDEVGRELSQRLRGEHNCDLLIALTHARLPNDIVLARDLGARTADTDVANTHGVDLILGGHDHCFYMGRAITSDFNPDGMLGAEKDDGVLLVKSGTDFHDLSELTLELVDSPETIRKKIVKSVTGKRHQTSPEDPKSEKLGKIIESLLSHVSGTLKNPVAITDVELNCHSEIIRTEESGAGNYFSDVLRHAYDDALCLKAGGGAHCVLSCAGTLRGDSSYGPGEVTMGDLLEILPFTDPIVVVQLDGETIWSALEGSLSKWPAQEGRFPIVSGLRVEWDSSKAAGSRVLSVQIDLSADEHHSKNTSDPPKWHSLEREKGGKLYRVVTREYLAQGHDGFESLKGCTYLIDDESGLNMSALVRRYLLGSAYLNAFRNKSDSPSEVQHLHEQTPSIIQGARERWRNAAHKVVEHRRHIRDASSIANREHMSDFDCFDGQAARTGKVAEKRSPVEVITIHPVVDGRLKDVARSK
ncbi:Metallo-dependent phosphatase [Auriculariales sp. MPI-PUGE-AT-0066]|nr:Metallo-dependent phosphatase [Auriculariales sp. MPI-PUGE-AT-0066]